MLPKADSAEFAALLDRWLDNAATDEEAALFWRCVTEVPACAAQFAAAARFEGLLADTVKAVNVEAEARKVLAVAPTRETAPHAAHHPPTTRRMAATTHSARPAPAPPPMRYFALAAALVILGLITAMLWPEEPAGTAQASKGGSTTPPVKPVSIVTAPPAAGQAPGTVPLSAKMDTAPADPRQVEAPQFVELALTARLDQFWLDGVSLNNVPLSQAMAALRQLLAETDDKHTLPLDKLGISVPAGAMNRRVSFQSDSIPYLKAVKAVAALAGCDVMVDDLSITLRLIPGIFPQVAEKRAMADLLASRMMPDGTATLQNQERINGLWQDAARLGITVADDGTANASGGQWAALAVMTDARDQRDVIEMPAFAIYVIPDGQVPQSRLLTAEETQQLQQRLLESGVQPVAVVVPDLDPPDNTRPMISAALGGEGVTYTPANAPGVQQQTTLNEPDQPLVGMVLTGQNLAYTGASTTLRGTAANAFNSSDNLMGSGKVVQGTIVIMPGWTAPLPTQNGASPP